MRLYFLCVSWDKVSNAIRQTRFLSLHCTVEYCSLNFPVLTPIQSSLFSYKTLASESRKPSLRIWSTNGFGIASFLVFDVLALFESTAFETFVLTLSSSRLKFIWRLKYRKQNKSLFCTSKLRPLGNFGFLASFLKRIKSSNNFRFFSNCRPLDVLRYDFNSQNSAMKPSILKQRLVTVVVSIFTLERMYRKFLWHHSTWWNNCADVLYGPEEDFWYQYTTCRYDMWKLLFRDAVNSDGSIDLYYRKFYHKFRTWNLEFWSVNGSELSFRTLYLFEKDRKHNPVNHYYELLDVSEGHDGI